MRRWSVPVCAAALLLLAACGTPNIVQEGAESAPPSAAAAEPSVTAEPSAAAAAQWTNQIFSKEYTTPDGTVLLLAHYTFPKLENVADFPGAAALNAWYAEQGAEFLSDSAGRAADLAEADYELAMNSGLSFSQYTEQLSYEITRQTADYVSVCRTLSTSGGGAQAASYRYAEQFSLTNGNRLLFSSFFTVPEDAAATALDYMETDAAARGIDSATLRNNFSEEHFYLTEDGVVFWYQSGELNDEFAPVEFTVPYETLSSLLRVW